MGMPKYSAKRDENEAELIQVYKQMGCSVHQLNEKGIPDLLIGYRGLTDLAEVKIKSGVLTPEQQVFKTEFNGTYRIVRTVQDVIKHVNQLIHQAEIRGKS